jgi:hypothetical protein
MLAPSIAPVNLFYVLKTAGIIRSVLQFYSKVLRIQKNYFFLVMLSAKNKNFHYLPIKYGKKRQQLDRRQ